MRKYSLPLRIAALLCALCLLLTGCGQVAVQDDTAPTAEPAATTVPTAEPAAEKTQENPCGSTLTQAFYIPGDQEVVLDYKDELYTPQSPATVQEFFRDDALAANLAEQRNAHIKPENIGSYELSKKLGGTITLKGFVRYGMGEGLEKRDDNFAEEIAKLTGKN
mgnify:CR=1 FL=1